MKHYIMALVMFLLAGGILSAQQIPAPQGVMSYQGMVRTGSGQPLADGEYPITVTLYADAEGTIQVWQDTYGTMINGGVFNIYLGSGKVPLPAPGQMDKALWIGTRIGNEEEMRPLTRLSASPYAINVPDGAITTSKLADGAVTEDKVSLEYISGLSVNGKKIALDGKVLNIQAGKDIDINFDEFTQSLIIGSPAGAGAGREKEERAALGTQQDAWTLQGDGVDVVTAAVIIPNPNDFIGTNGNNTPFTVKVNGLRVMRYQPNGLINTPSIIGGHVSNAAAAAGVGNTIAGGGGAGVPNTIDGVTYNVISGGADNSILNVNSAFGVIAGGQENTIGTAAALVNYGTIGGGLLNVVTATYGTIGGGHSHNVSAVNSTVGGGIGNIISGSEATIAGGDGNQIARREATIGGGYRNRIIGTADYGTIAGGYTNTVNGQYGAIGGGQTNEIVGIWGVIGGGFTNNILNANSVFGVIAGGQENTIGTAAAAVNYGTIGGGLQNVVTATYGTIGGGHAHSVSAVNSTVGGGIGNTISGSEATIAGGDGNQITKSESTIGGGFRNQIGADYATIAGGYINIISGQYGAIGGGQTNEIVGTWGVIGGGLTNRVLNVNSVFGTIAGGQENTIGTAAALVNYGTISGGLQNVVTATYGTIGGGHAHSVSGVNSTVGGGIGNIISGSEATIAGGDGNQITRREATIGGGFRNQIVADYGTIAGGATNAINGQYGAIGGGLTNSILLAGSTYGTIAGGENNAIGGAVGAATHGTIGGGQGHRITGNYGFVGGGQTNTIFGPWGVIGGGLSNNVLNVNSAFGVIAGGQSNQIGTAAALTNYGTIGGGLLNVVTATYGTIAGGRSSSVSAVHGSVGGGIGNSVSGPLGTIAGGDGNQTTTTNAALGGGYHNRIVANGFSATIPGGENLTAQSYGQAVVGVLNIPKGTIAPGGAPNDEPIFIVGNGIQGFQSNAFEVSYNGHSTVFHNTGGATPVVFGGTYADNVIHAWGNVDQGGGRICDFGVRNVTQLGTGWYQIEMDIVDPDGNPLQINCGSVTATVANTDAPGSGNFRCAVINVSQIQNNVFDVHISDPGCNPIDEAFNFKVTGRP
jgi:hypothetical protein